MSEETSLTTKCPADATNINEAVARGGSPMTITQDTTTFTYRYQATMEMPRVITADTDPQTADHAISAFYGVAYSWHGTATKRAVIEAVITAMMEHSPLTIGYTNEQGAVSARTIYPTSVRVTNDHHIEVKAYCTKRRMTRDFRTDRMFDVQEVVPYGTPATENVAA